MLLCAAVNILDYLQQKGKVTDNAIIVRYLIIKLEVNYEMLIYAGNENSYFAIRGKYIIYLS